MLRLGSKKRRQAFEKEALPHLDALYGMALRLTKDEQRASDLVQDSLVKAYRFFHRYEEGTNVKAWLFKVLVNTFYNICRKQRKDVRVAAEADTELYHERFLSAATISGQRSEEVLLDALVVEKLREAVEELPEEFRSAVLLCDLHDFSYKEIAEILGCPVGTVMSRLYRGRRLLQRRLYDYAVEQGYIKAAASASTEPQPAQESSEPTDLEAYRQTKGKRG